VGPHDKQWGERFIDMSAPYDADLRRQARKVAAELKLKCSEGVYAALLGPSFETPAEIKALKQGGAGAVGMSTVPEVIAARHMGLRVLAVSCVTNLAAGLSQEPINHLEVLEIGARVQKELVALLTAVIPRMVRALHPQA